MLSPEGMIFFHHPGVPRELPTKSWKQELTGKIPPRSSTQEGAEVVGCSETGQASASNPQSHFPLILNSVSIE